MRKLKPDFFSENKKINQEKDKNTNQEQEKLLETPSPYEEIYAKVQQYISDIPGGVDGLPNKDLFFHSLQILIANLGICDDKIRDCINSFKGLPHAKKHIDAPINLIMLYLFYEQASVGNIPLFSQLKFIEDKKKFLNDIFGIIFKDTESGYDSLLKTIGQLTPEETAVINAAIEIYIKFRNRPEEDAASIMAPIIFILATDKVDKSHYKFEYREFKNYISNHININDVELVKVYLMLLVYASIFLARHFYDGSLSLDSLDYPYHSDASLFLKEFNEIGALYFGAENLPLNFFRDPELFFSNFLKPLFTFLKINACDIQFTRTENGQGWCRPDKIEGENESNVFFR